MLGEKELVKLFPDFADLVQPSGIDLELDRIYTQKSGGSLIDNEKNLPEIKEMEKRLDEVYITVNKNAIPNDPEKPPITSGVRIGTAAVSTRGLGTEEMKQIASCIYRAATDFENSADAIRAEVNAICERFPLYK